MRLFLRENVPFIMLQILQVVTILGLLLLADYRDIQMILYVVFMSLFWGGGYVIYMYVTRKPYYQKLTQPLASLDESLEDIGNSPLARELQALLKKQYMLYAEQLLSEEKKKEEYNMFLDRWIHQMKTPVAVLHLMAKELDEPIASDVQAEVDRVETGLEMALYMSRIRSITHDFHIEQVSLKELLQQVLKEHRRLFIRQKVYPSMEDLDDVQVETDKKWFHFVVTQIIQNAVKYSIGDGKQIGISWQEAAGKTVLEIKDDGIGIPKEDVQRVFDPFFTGENGRQFRESTGMGLYLVKEVLTYLAHQIEVNSVLGQGTTFRITF